MALTSLSESRPGVNHDRANNYFVGSRVIVTNPASSFIEEWVCTDNTTGAAVWQRTVHNQLLGPGSTPTFVDLLLSDLSGTYSIHDWVNKTQGAVIVEGCEITEAAAQDGTVDISAGVGMIKTADSAVGTTQFFDIAKEDSFALDAGVNFIYVNYAAPPVFAKTGDQTTINLRTEIGLGRVYKNGNDHIHILNGGQRLPELGTTLLRYLRSTVGIVRASGLLTSKSAHEDLALQVTAGSLYAVITPFTIDAFDIGNSEAITDLDQGNKLFMVSGDIADHFVHGESILVHGSTGNDGVYTVEGATYDVGDDETDIEVEEAIPDATVDGHIHDRTFRSFYRDGGVDWTEVPGVVDVDVEHYDDDSGTLHALTANRYAVHWGFIDFDGHLMLVYGQGNYTAAQAELATMPATLPDLADKFSLPICKIIVQKSETDLANASIETPFETPFATSAVTVHNDLGSLQGGTADEYYHLTSAEHTEATQDATDALTGLATDVQITKLDGIEALADVTDATNVAGAGALMDADLDAKGDLISASADDTPELLGVGDDDDVLTADSGEASGLKWAPPAAPAGTLLESDFSAKGDLLGASADDTLEVLNVGDDDDVLTADSGEASGLKWAPPATHAASHENAGGDEMSVAGLSGELADNQNPTAHAAEHVDGTDDIQDATDAQKGVATAAQITKLDAIAAGADVTGDNAPQAHVHDGDTLQIDAINSDGGAFAFDTTGAVTFNQDIVVPNLFVGDGGTLGIDGNELITFNAAGTIAFSGATLELEATSSTTGHITQAGDRVFHTYGTNNLFMGSLAGNFTLTGNGNWGAGTAALLALTDGQYNWAGGYHALLSVTEGDSNLALGFSAGDAITTGNYNLMAGHNAGGALTIETYNVFIGYGAGQAATSAFAIGVGAATGRDSTGAGGVYVGHNAGRDIGSGNYNICIGYQAGLGAIAGATGHSNIAIGYRAMYNAFTNAGYNVAIGWSAMDALTTGDINVAIGASAGGALTTGEYNTLIGADSGYSLVTDSYGVMIGYQAGYYETAGAKLFIDVLKRTNEADGRVKALVYGVFAAATADQSLLVNGYLWNREGMAGYERATDPAEPAEGEYVIWMSDGTGKGDDGDVLVASQAGGTTNYGTLFDHSEGVAW
ncbi:MAG: hypothetical protein JRL30_01150 [Deltaproteobacteria bacterium]|nr:hypothetical protein [Deltaproteobacteria bacterium]